MKMKSINKILTSILSISMLVGSSMPVLAAEADEGVDVNAPIYSLDITNVIVPTSYAVAFNPEELTVKTGTTVSGGDTVSVTSTSQILSKTYGIINKSSKDKLITVTLNVQDMNDGSGITFVNSKQDVTDAKEGEYKIHLMVIPADTTEVKVAGASADHNTAATALSDVAMTPAAAGKEVTLMAGENYLGFKLDRAIYTPKEGKELELGATNSNDVKDNFDLTGLAEDGKGITAFTFGGEMNQSADWSALTKGIKINVIYGNDKVTSDLTAIDGTGAMVKVNIAPTFATGDGIGQIKYTRGAGDDGVKEIKAVQLILKGKANDGYHANSTYWSAATDEEGVITLDSKFMAYVTSGDTVEATVVYVTNAQEEKKVAVDIARVDPLPAFTSNVVGQINYTMGLGGKGLKEIKKIEVNYSGKVYDVYNVLSAKWKAATDEAGVITFDSGVSTNIKSSDAFEATVTYVTVDGETRTATVNIQFNN